MGDNYSSSLTRQTLGAITVKGIVTHTHTHTKWEGKRKRKQTSICKANMQPNDNGKRRMRKRNPNHAWITDDAFNTNPDQSRSFLQLHE